MKVARFVFLLLIVVCASIAAAASITHSGDRVKGLHWVAATTTPPAAGYHGASFGLSMTGVPAVPTGGGSWRYGWSADGVQFASGIGLSSATYVAHGVGKHTITCTTSLTNDVPSGPDGLPITSYSATTTIAAIGGPLGFIRINGETGLDCWSRDDGDDPNKSWYLQYFGYGPNDVTYPTIDQKPQTFSVISPGQLSTGATTYTWSVVGTSAQLKGTPTSSTTEVTVGAKAANGTSRVKLLVHYVDTSDPALVGDAEDDTDEVPGSDGLVHAGMWHFHSHGPDLLEEVSKTAAKAKDAGGNPSDNTIGPWIPPHLLAYGYGDEYQYKLLDKDGEPMPGVYIKEDILGFSALMGRWKTLTSPAGSFDQPDYISIVGASIPFPSTGSPACAGTHYYKGGIKVWSSSRGILVKQCPIKIWTDSTENG